MSTFGPLDFLDGFAAVNSGSGSGKQHQANQQSASPRGLSFSPFSTLPFSSSQYLSSFAPTSSKYIRLMHQSSLSINAVAIGIAD
ncbi:hypothetical protein TYRP_018368 [Tyrophagus putrescentiae]|nr:hypothetical protein TYRP_018368 [Tyrophagus putrescentiae]